MEVIEPIYFFTVTKDSASFDKFGWTAYCSITGPNLGIVGGFRTFPNERAVTTALDSAGIHEARYKAAVTAVKSGYPSFFHITLEEAKFLGLAEEN